MSHPVRYQFGQTVSVPFFDGEWRPDSFYDKIKYNAGGKMHTLVLVDIKVRAFNGLGGRSDVEDNALSAFPWAELCNVTACCPLDVLFRQVKEPDFDEMLKNRTAFLPPRFMTVNQCVAQLLEVEGNRKEGVCGPTRLAIGVARLGQPSQQITFGTLAELACVDFGEPLHSLVLCGEMHELEEAFLAPLRAPPATPEASAAAVARASAEVAALVRKQEPGDGDDDDDGDGGDNGVGGGAEECGGNGGGGGGGVSSPDAMGASEAMVATASASAASSAVDTAGVGAASSRPAATVLDDDDLEELCGLSPGDFKADGGSAIVSDDEE